MNDELKINKIQLDEVYERMIYLEYNYTKLVKFIQENHDVDYEEILASGYLKVTPLKDLKESSLKKFFDELIEKAKTNIIEKNIWILEEYMEWVESNQPPQ